MILTSWIHEEFGDKELLDRREAIMRELELAGDDLSKLRKLMPEMKRIANEIERLTILRQTARRQQELIAISKRDSVSE